MAKLDERVLAIKKKHSNSKEITKFYYELFNLRSENGLFSYSNIRKLFEIVIVISHGNGEVERGFSLSKKIINDEYFDVI
jgi:hypothetical protein